MTAALNWWLLGNIRRPLGATIVAAAVAISSAAIYKTTIGGGGGGGGGVPTTANIWVDGTGGSCTRSASLVAYNSGTACGSLDAANDICQNNDTVIVKPATYNFSSGQNQLTGTNSRSAYCNFYPQSGSTVTIGVSTCAPCLDVMGSGGWVKFNGGASNNFTSPSNSATTIDFGVDHYIGRWDTESGCTHVWFDHVHIGNTNLICDTQTVSNSELGPAVDNNTKLFGNGPTLLDSDTFHDVARSNAGQHLECVYYQAASFVTIRASTFFNCADIAIHAKEPGTGNMSHDTIENSIFKASANNIEFTGFTPCDNLIIRYNVIESNITLGNEGAVCSPLDITGNVLFFTGAGCPSSSSWSYNIFTTGSTCGSNSSVSAASNIFVDQPGGNYHLKGGSPAIDAGNPSDYPSTDITGLSRFLGSAPDVGPYEAS